MARLVLRLVLGLAAALVLVRPAGAMAQATEATEATEDSAESAASAEVDSPLADPPLADPPVDRAAEAQALFRRGLELGTEDRWADALEHFRRSFARVPRPSTLFNIAVALGRLGRFVEAIAVFDEVFAGSEALPPAAQAEAVRLSAEAQASLGHLDLTLNPDDATIYVDGAARAGAGSPRAIELDPGRHVLRATADGRLDGSLVVSVVAGERATGRLALDLADAIDDPIVDPIVGPIETPHETGIFEEPAFWIVGSVIVVVLGVGIGVGVGYGTSGPPPTYGGTTGVILTPP